MGCAKSRYILKEHDLYLIAFFGFILSLLSAVMVINPEYWSNGIVKFSQKSFFHPFEIISRFIFGSGFIIYSHQTLYPTLMLIIGYSLVGVGIGLSLTPPTKHKQFAVWSAKRFKRFFRPAGIFSFSVGIFIVYAALCV